MKSRGSLVTSIAAMACALTMLNGCVGYQLGSMLPADIKTVYVPTFENSTGEPLVEIETTRATINEIQRDGSLKIAEANTADAILQVKIIDYELDPLAYDDGTKTLVDEYRAELTASIVLYRRDGSGVLAEDPRVRGESTFEFGGDLTAAKRLALPEAARDLAHDIVERIVEAW